jgi:hypothetical protein
MLFLHMILDKQAGVIGPANGMTGSYRGSRAWGKPLYFGLLDLNGWRTLVQTTYQRHVDTFNTQTPRDTATVDTGLLTSNGRDMIIPPSVKGFSILELA